MVETAVGVCQSVMEKGVAIEQVDLDLINSRIAGNRKLVSSVAVQHVMGSRGYGRGKAQGYST